MADAKPVPRGKLRRSESAADPPVFRGLPHLCRALLPIAQLQAGRARRITGAWPSVWKESLLPMLRQKVQGDAQLCRHIQKMRQALRAPKAANPAGLPVDGLAEAVADLVPWASDGEFSTAVWPWMRDLLAGLPAMFPAGQPVPLLRQGHAASVTLHRDKACALVAAMFVGWTDEGAGADGQDLELNSQNCDVLLAYSPQFTACLLNYLRRMASDARGPRGTLTLQRLVLSPAEQVDWATCDAPLVAVEAEAEGVIEDTPAHGALSLKLPPCSGHLHADFANQYIGGGALNGGNVQEEILFMIRPECIVSQLLCPRMDTSEAVWITGAERFSNYSGYGGSMEFSVFGFSANKKGNHVDPMVDADTGQPEATIVAFDALETGFKQFETSQVHRELIKASAALVNPADNRPFATGNWGCGAFGGDKDLKGLVQWMAASAAGRPLRYFTFGDRSLKDRWDAVGQAVRAMPTPPTVGDVYTWLMGMPAKYRAKGALDWIR
eukprot:gene11707-2129_t